MNPLPRIDWQLIRPARPGKKHARVLDEVEPLIEAQVYDATQRVFGERELDQLRALEDRHDNATIASCEAAHAPRVEDDPDWETRIVDEFSETDTELELDEYLDLRRREFDCDRCPHASPFSLFPQDPCEISVGPLLVALDVRITTRLSEPMGPDDMIALADDLDRARGGEHIVVPGIDVADLMAKASKFLRFWARLGFGVRPEVVDSLSPIQTPDGPVGPLVTDHAPVYH